MKVRKNETIAAKRRVKVFVTLDDGVTPAPASSLFAAVAASVALTGTHAATLTWNLTGIVGNGKTIALVADGTGAGSLTVTGNAYVFHYATGVTTMANFVTAAAGVFVFSGHTPTDVLAATGDTQAGTRAAALYPSLTAAYPDLVFEDRSIFRHWRARSICW